MRLVLNVFSAYAALLLTQVVLADTTKDLNDETRVLFQNIFGGGTGSMSTRPPTPRPTPETTGPPTVPPTKAPTEPPTRAPTSPPTKAPTDPPTPVPSHSPSAPPTDSPSDRPSPLVFCLVDVSIIIGLLTF